MSRKYINKSSHSRNKISLSDSYSKLSGNVKVLVTELRPNLPLSREKVGFAKITESVLI